MTKGPETPEEEARIWACFNIVAMVDQLTVEQPDGRRDMYAGLVGIAQGLGLLFEHAPEHKTPSDMRKAIDQFADLIKSYAKQARKDHERDGVRMVDAILEDARRTRQDEQVDTSERTPPMN